MQDPFILSLSKIVKKAGEFVLSERKSGNVRIKIKEDGTPVTNVDADSEILIMELIKEHFGTSSIIIGEEATSNGTIIDPKNKEFWCIDPIDGTKSFISGKDSFCVSIGYIENKKIMGGAIYIPTTTENFVAKRDVGTFKFLNDEVKKIECREVPKSGAIGLIRGKTSIPIEIINRFHNPKIIQVDSAIKFAMIAEGKMDFYIRNHGKASEWDIAGGHALIVAAGGTILDFEGNEPTYGNPPFTYGNMIARGK